jgi:DNA repair protein RecO (recombination protein O)
MGEQAWRQTAMPLRDCEAIILRSYPLGEADRLVSFLSRSFGRMRGVANGARRPKSRFGAALECCSYIRVWFYERETRDLVQINQCELQESFLSAFGNYEAGNTLSLLAEISEAVLPEREPLDASFRLLLSTARAIQKTGQKTGQTALPAAYFCLWTMRLSGWLPALDRCARCGESLAGKPGYATPARSGLWCQKCRKPGMSIVSAGALDAARPMLNEGLQVLLECTPPFPLQPLQELTTFLLNGIEHQIERKLTTRAFMNANGMETKV